MNPTRANVFKGTKLQPLPARFAINRRRTFKSKFIFSLNNIHTHTLLLVWPIVSQPYLYRIVSNETVTVRNYRTLSQLEIVQQTLLLLLLLGFGELIGENSTANSSRLLARSSTVRTYCSAHRRIGINDPAP